MTKEERKKYMREYMRNYRATMSEYQYKVQRRRDNARLRLKYFNMTDEEKKIFSEKMKFYKIQKQNKNV